MNGCTPHDVDLLELVADLLRGGRHCRATVARAWSCSLNTADRRLLAIERLIPGVRRVKEGKTSWLEILPAYRTRAPRPRIACDPDQWPATVDRSTVG